MKLCSRTFQNFGPTNLSMKMYARKVIWQILVHFRIYFRFKNWFKFSLELCWGLQSTVIYAKTLFSNILAHFRFYFRLKNHEILSETDPKLPSGYCPWLVMLYLKPPGYSIISCFPDFEFAPTKSDSKNCLIISFDLVSLQNFGPKFFSKNQIFYTRCGVLNYAENDGNSFIPREWAQIALLDYHYTLDFTWTTYFTCVQVIRHSVIINSVHPTSKNGFKLGNSQWLITLIRTWTSFNVTSLHYTNTCKRKITTEGTCLQTFSPHMNHISKKRLKFPISPQLARDPLYSDMFDSSVS